jgi:hypothetical protein
MVRCGSVGDSGAAMGKAVDAAVFGGGGGNGGSSSGGGLRPCVSSILIQETGI